MRDYKTGPTFHQYGESRLYQSFTFGIQITGSLVKNENTWISQRRSGNGESLPLAATQFEASFSNHRVVAIWQLFNERVRVGYFSRFPNIVIGCHTFAITDIGRNRPVK